MARKFHQTNFRVEVSPKSLGDMGGLRISDRFCCDGEEDRQKQYKERCHSIAREIHRHIGEVDSVDVIFDTEVTCEHCGAKWTETSGTYNGGCCDEDEAANTSPLTAPGAALGMGA